LHFLQSFGVLDALKIEIDDFGFDEELIIYELQLLDLLGDLLQEGGNLKRAWSICTFILHSCHLSLSCLSDALNLLLHLDIVLDFLEVVFNQIISHFIYIPNLFICLGSAADVPLVLKTLSVLLMSTFMFAFSPIASTFYVDVRKLLLLQLGIGTHRPQCSMFACHASRHQYRCALNEIVLDM
jgi:hypothetical protein